jgi:hypothetical protein
MADYEQIKRGDEETTPEVNSHPNTAIDVVPFRNIVKSDHDENHQKRRRGNHHISTGKISQTKKMPRHATDEETNGRTKTIHERG